MSLTPKSISVFTRRRIRNSIITLALLALMAVVVYAQTQSLRHASFTTGYLLMGSIAFLAAFNLRKKITFLPAVGSAASWMQLHIYVGFATFVMFGAHVAWHVPNGWFEGWLAILYFTVALSGVYGLYATRIYPGRLTGINDEVIFERIPAFRQRIATRARTLVLQACETTDVLAKLYANRLMSYFEKPPRLVYLLHPNGRTRRQLVAEIEDVNRYLVESQRGIGKQLSAMVKQRDDLDYHHAIQGRLKIWMFVHIGLTYSLIAVALLHIVMVHAFAGGGA
ncbi:MAG: hypothetical protein ACI87E_002705 [Mariniblastus sp.]|jgi:hypothetical protein